MLFLFRFAVKELRKSPFWTLLTFFVCVLALSTVIGAITSSASSVYQRKIIERNIGYDMEKILHLHYMDTKETDEFAEVLENFLESLENIEGVDSVGKFDKTGIFFEELENNADYQNINSTILRETESIYQDVPGISQIIFMDSETFALSDSKLTEYPIAGSGALPIMVSEAFSEILPLGTQLTSSGTKETYEVVGFLGKDMSWFDENDIIRFPMIGLNGFFIAPFPESYRHDIMAQLCCLHNTYLFIEHDADIEKTKSDISSTAENLGFRASGNTIAEEFESYSDETAYLVKSQTALSVFISIMAMTSIISVFTANVILRKRKYGILLANGFSRNNLAVMLTFQAGIIIGTATVLTWAVKWIKLQRSGELSIALFRNVMLTAHIQFSLPISILLCIGLITLSVILPSINIFRFSPSELIGGEVNYGNY